MRRRAAEVFAVAALGLCLLRPGSSLAQDADSAASLFVTRVEPPRAVPSVTFLDRAGHQAALADFRGRVVVLNLWATWCGPCIAEMPALDKLQSSLAGEPFAVVAVSLDREGKRVVDAFFQRTGVANLAQYFDPRGRLSKELEAVGMPTTLIIDHAGREVGRVNGSIDWSSAGMHDYLRPFITDARANAGAPLNEQ